MTVTTIVILICILIGLFIGANAVSQYHQKQASERRQRLLKLAATVSESEELLTNAVELPMSNVLIAILLKRMTDVFKQIIKLAPDVNNINERLKDTQERLTGIDTGESTVPPLTVPKNDRHIAALIKTIKKIRHILALEKRNGNLNDHNFTTEDKVLGTLSMKIFTQYKINQGLAAMADEQLGSARQFFEKAMKNLLAQDSDDEYISAKTKEVRQYLKDINTQLLSSDQSPAQDGDGSEKGVDDLELFFSDTKRKW